MIRSDDALETVTVAHHDRQHDDQREPGNNRAKKEIGWKLSGMPTGSEPAGKIEADDAVHRNDHRRHDRAHDEVDALVVAPVARRASPAERQNAVEHLLSAMLRLVSHGGEVGQQPSVIEHYR